MRMTDWIILGVIVACSHGAAQLLNLSWRLTHRKEDDPTHPEWEHPGRPR
jgi:hypothetical protein